MLQLAWRVVQGKCHLDAYSVVQWPQWSAITRALYITRARESVSIEPVTLAPEYLKSED